MKKTALLFGVFLSFCAGSSLHATDVRVVDSFNLKTGTIRIVWHLRDCEEVPDAEIKKIFSTVKVRSDNSSTSSDEEGKAGVVPPQAKTISSLVADFIEVTEDTAPDHSRRMKKEISSLIASLNAFARKVLALEKENNPLIVKRVLDNIAEEYC